MLPGFGFSVGDFITGLDLIRQLIKALEDSTGSLKEYRDLIRELYSLERALIEVKHLKVDESLQHQQNALTQAAAQCQETISMFLEQIATHQSSLRTGGSGNSWRDRLRKIQWALYKKDDVQKFRAQIQGHTASITILLMTLKLGESSLNSQDSNATRPCCSHDNQFSQIGKPASQTNDILSVLKYLLPTLQRIASVSPERPSTPHHEDLSSVVNEVRERNLEIYRMVLKMQTNLPPQVERQQPVYFLDACGFLAPFHLEFINSWEAFVAVLGVKFKHRGLSVVERKQYVLEDANRRRLINMARPFEACFFPGQQVNMDACFDEKTGTGNYCPGCQHVESMASDQAIDCSNCGTHYRRIEELVTLPRPQERMHSAESLTSGKRKATELDDVDQLDSMALEDEISQYRRIRLRSRKILLERPSKVQILQTESMAHSSTSSYDLDFRRHPSIQSTSSVLASSSSKRLIPHSQESPTHSPLRTPTMKALGLGFPSVFSDMSQAQNALISRKIIEYTFSPRRRPSVQSASSSSSSSSPDLRFSDNSSQSSATSWTPTSVKLARLATLRSQGLAYPGQLECPYDGLDSSNPAGSLLLPDTHPRSVIDGRLPENRQCLFEGLKSSESAVASFTPEYGFGYELSFLEPMSSPDLDILRLSDPEIDVLDLETDTPQTTGGPSGSKRSRSSIDLSLDENARNFLGTNARSYLADVSKFTTNIGRTFVQPSDFLVNPLPPIRPPRSLPVEKGLERERKCCASQPNSMRFTLHGPGMWEGVL